MRTPTTLLAVSLMLPAWAVAPAHAGEPGAELAQEPEPMSAELARPADVEFEACLINKTEHTEAAMLELEADRIDREQQMWYLQGNAKVHYKDLKLAAGAVRINGELSQLSVTDGMTASSPGLRIAGEAARINYDTGAVIGENLRYRLEEGVDNTSPGGTAKRLTRDDNGVLKLTQATYTTCAPGDAAWQIEADTVELDPNTGQGRARGVRLRVGDYPVVNVPWLPFPVGSQRRSGWLAPKFEESASAGISVEIPYYFNLAPHYDLTVTPRIMSERGVQLGARLRYRSHAGDGALGGEWLDDSEESDTDGTPEAPDYGRANRYLIDWRHSKVAGNWDTHVRYVNLSDVDYLDDFSSDELSRTIPYIPQLAQVNYRGDHIGMSLEVSGTERIEPGRELWDRLPRLRAHAEAPAAWMPGGLTARVDFAADAFDENDAGTAAAAARYALDGERLGLGLTVSRPFAGDGWYVTPKARVRHIGYDLEGVAADVDDSPSRTVSEASLAAGLRFERMTKGGLVHTLEPQLFYLNRKHKTESNEQLFDTILSRLDYAAMFRADAHTSFDRTPATNQLTVGLTTRVIDPVSGREKLTASIGRIWYLRDAEADDDRRFSTYAQSTIAGEVTYRPRKDISVRAEGRYLGSDKAGSTVPWRSVVARYQPNDSLLQLQYLYDDEDPDTERFEQASAIGVYDFGQGWRLGGQYHYDLERNGHARQVLAAEYSSCCVGVSVGIEREHGDTDRFIFQLQLRGLGGARDTAVDTLIRDVTGNTPWWR